MFPMKPMQKTESLEQPKSTSPVLVLFENEEARDRAVKFCDALISRFWREHEFEVTWCSFASLDDHPNAQQCCSKATRADVVIFATCCLPGEIRNWIDTWIE